ncbi:unnamed protein product [Prorocentrum cordatum]|uniref:Uncharacterized protein n=1 Tax=Prorocentrum cordatum TaxID=2364126 RepID=A0ABN9X932_9DINO|nr:unnamed protein product [Polarella glacialis]
MKETIASALNRKKLHWLGLAPETQPPRAHLSGRLPKDACARWSDQFLKVKECITFSGLTASGHHLQASIAARRALARPAHMLRRRPLPSLNIRTPTVDLRHPVAGTVGPCESASLGFREMFLLFSGSDAPLPCRAHRALCTLLHGSTKHARSAECVPQR